PMLSTPCLGSLNQNSLYRIGYSGTWEKLDSPAREVVNDKSQKFFEFYTKCGGKFNCDKKLWATRVKFKTRNLKKLISLSATSNCPLLNLKYYPHKRNKIIYGKIPCVDRDSL